MSEFTPWLGICHLRQAAGTNAVTQPTLAAAWADCIESFEREMHVHTNARSLQMIWAEDVMPANEWLTKHPHGKDGQRLTGKVNAKHLVEVGALGVGATGLGLDGTPDGEAEGYLHIEEIEGVEPLDMQFGVHPPKTVPDALYEPLFGQPEPSAAEVVHYGTEPVPPLNTYAILDAAKVVNFVEMLEASGLEHRCLFKGEAAEEMRDVAPYVVRLKEDVEFSRNLFSKDPKQEVPWFMWDREPGIYVRSRGTLEDMWKHFRKFTKVQDEDGKWFYFRFWEARVFSKYFKAVYNKKGVAQMFLGVKFDVKLIYVQALGPLIAVSANTTKIENRNIKFTIYIDVLTANSAQNQIETICRNHQMPYRESDYSGYSFARFTKEDVQIVAFMHGHFNVIVKYDPDDYPSRKTRQSKIEHIMKLLFFKKQRVPYGM